MQQLFDNFISHTHIMFLFSLFFFLFLLFLTNRNRENRSYLKVVNNGCLYIITLKEYVNQNKYQVSMGCQWAMLLKLLIMVVLLNIALQIAPQ